MRLSRELIEWLPHFIYGTRPRLLKAIGLAWGLAWFVLGLVAAILLLRMLAGSSSLTSLLPLLVILYTVMGGASVAVYSSRTLVKMVASFSRSFRKKFIQGPLIFPDVSIIIPVYNGEATIGRVIRAILNQDYPLNQIEVIIVDDGSTDSTWDIVRWYKIKYPHIIKAIRHRANLGKTEALTKGARIARGDIIVTLDADTILARDALRRIVAQLVFNDSVGAVCGRIVPIGTSGLLYWMQRIEYFLGFNLGRFTDAILDKASLILSGAFSAFRAAILKALSAKGLPSDTVAEDFDLTVLVWKKNYRTSYEHNAVAYTVIPRRLRDLYKQRIRWYGGGLQVLLKHLDLLRIMRIRAPSEYYGRMLALRLLGLEYLLPILQVTGYIILVVSIIAYTILDINLFAVPLEAFLATYIASLIAIIVLGGLNIVVAYSAEEGVSKGVKIMPFAFLYTAFYIPFLAIAKTDASIRVLLQDIISW